MTGAAPTSSKEPHPKAPEAHSTTGKWEDSMEPWMIEQIRKRREQEQREAERPRLRIQPPAHEWPEQAEPPAAEDEDQERGVWIIQM